MRRVMKLLRCFARGGNIPEYHDGAQAVIFAVVDRGNGGFNWNADTIATKQKAVRQMLLATLFHSRL